MKHFALTTSLAVATLSANAFAHIDHGQLWIMDRSNSVVYFVDQTDFSVTINGLMTSFVDEPGGIGFTPHGHMLIVNHGDDVVHEFNGLGGHWEPLSGMDGISGVKGASALAMGPGHGDIFVANRDASEIIVFNDDFESEGVFADAADGLVSPVAIAFLTDGHLMVVDEGASAAIHFDHETGVGTIFDRFTGETPIDVLIRGNGDLYILADTGNLYRYAGGLASGKSLLGTYGSGEGSITFGMGFQTIYHVNAGDSKLRSIDADTGAAVDLATVPGLPTHIDAVGTHVAHGGYAEYGNGLAGTGGIKPELHGHDEPRVGLPVEVEIHDVIGAAIVAFGYSTGLAEIPMFGGDFLLDPAGTYTYFSDPHLASGMPGVAGDGEFIAAFTIPNMPVLVGMDFFWQGAALDPGAIQGVALSQGLHMFIGI